MNEKMWIMHCLSLLLTLAMLLAYSLHHGSAHSVPFTGAVFDAMNKLGLFLHLCLKTFST
jgi:hypothetical protein